MNRCNRRISSICFFFNYGYIYFDYSFKFCYWVYKKQHHRYDFLPILQYFHLNTIMKFWQILLLQWNLYQLTYVNVFTYMVLNKNYIIVIKSFGKTWIFCRKRDVQITRKSDETRINQLLKMFIAAKKNLAKIWHSVIFFWIHWHFLIGECYEHNLIITIIMSFIKKERVLMSEIWYTIMKQSLPPSLKI